MAPKSTKKYQLNFNPLFTTQFQLNITNMNSEVGILRPDQKYVLQFSCPLYPGSYRNKTGQALPVNHRPRGFVRMMKRRRKSPRRENRRSSLNRTLNGRQEGEKFQDQSESNDDNAKNGCGVFTIQLKGWKGGTGGNHVAEKEKCGIQGQVMVRQNVFQNSHERDLSRHQGDGLVLALTGFNQEGRTAVNNSAERPQTAQSQSSTCSYGADVISEAERQIQEIIDTLKATDFDPDCERQVNDVTVRHPTASKEQNFHSHSITEVPHDPLDISNFNLSSFEEDDPLIVRGRNRSKAPSGHRSIGHRSRRSSSSSESGLSESDWRRVLWHGSVPDISRPRSKSKPVNRSRSWSGLPGDKQKRKNAVDDLLELHDLLEEITNNILAGSRSKSRSRSRSTSSKVSIKNFFLRFRQ